LVVNFDSFPEMETNTVIDYMNHSKLLSSKLLSINHETLSERTTHDIARNTCGFSTIWRYPYWVRNGYVEELYHTNSISRMKKLVKFIIKKFKK
jgi:hypothetical protein